MDLQVLHHEQEKMLFDMKALMTTADKERRGLTEAEQHVYADLKRGLGDVGKRIDKEQGDAYMAAEINRLTGGAGDTGRPGQILVSRLGGAKTFGQRFVESDVFAWLTKTKHTRPEKWTSESVEIERFALTEDPASGGALVVPDYQRTIHPGPIGPIVVADLMAPGTTTSNMVPVMIEESFTNAAAPVAETGLKPESALTFKLQNEPVKKIATWIPVSDELLEDQAATAAYIDARLKYGVRRKEDQQLLFGTGVAPELLGILMRPGLAPDVARVDPATNADAILAQIVAIEAAAGLPVSGVVMNPLAWAAIIGTKLLNGEDLAGGPFGSQAAPMIWNRQVAVTDQMTADVALVGAFRAGAQVFRNGGIRTDATNSHADLFIKDMTALRAVSRFALAVYRPSAFGRVTGLTTMAPVVTP